MKRIKKVKTVVIIVFMVIVTLTECSQNAASAILMQRAPVRVAVFLYDLSDNFIQLIKENLEDVQKENKGNSAGIQTQQIELRVCNWFENLDYDAIKALFLKYGNQIEVIISNNDAMAMGAIKALQEYGYNLGNKSNTIPVIDVDVIPQAKELIEKGEMLGQVYKDARAYADALYICGMNLVAGKSLIEGTNYKLDDTQVAIRIPQTEYFYNNIFS